MENTLVKREGFIVYACPSKTVKYITRNGETNCCNGDIINNECNGNNVCSLSPSNSLNLQTCQTYVTNLANQASAANCFADMPYYFASSDESLRGCSLSHATPDGTAPSDPTKLQCILYPTEALDKVKLDSCYNYKLNKNALSGANCKAAITLPESYTPTQNTVLMKKFAMTSDYELDFDITPTAASSSQWQNIIHFSSNNTDSSAFGSRSPAIWFVPGTLNLHVRVGDSTNFNFGFDSQAGCTQGNQSHVNLRCKGKNVILTIDSNIYKLTQPTSRYTGNVIVYGSCPWYPAAKCLIENLRIRNYATSEIAAPKVSTMDPPKAMSMATPLLSKAAALVAPVAPANSTGYVMSGEGISGNLPVQKIIAGIVPSGGNFTFYFSQNGSSISIVWALTEDTNNILVSGDIPGKLSDHSFTDMPTFLNSTIGKTIESKIIRKKYKVSKV